MMGLLYKDSGPPARGGEPPLVSHGQAKMNLRSKVTRQKLVIHTLKFYSIFFKKSWGRGAKPSARPAGRETLLRHEAQEGRKKRPVDVSFVGNPRRGFPGEIKFFYKMNPEQTQICSGFSLA